MMVIGAITACAHGVSMPLLMVFFGEMIDEFVNSGKFAFAHPP